MHLPTLDFSHYNKLSPFLAYCRTTRIVKSAVKIGDALYQSKVVQQTILVAHSIVGQVVKCTAAELTGSLVGGTVLRKAGELVPVEMIPNTLAIAVLITGSSACYAHATELEGNYVKRFKTGLKIATIAVVILSLVGTDEPLVAQITEIAGGLFGGYCGLKLAGSPIVLKEKNSQRDSYLVSMIRFISIGLLFNAVVATPKNPYLRPLLMAPRKVTCSILQTIAYSSHRFFPFVKKCFARKKISKRLLIPLVGKMAADVWGGGTSLAVSRQLSQLIMAPLKGIIETHQELLSSVVGKGLDSIVDKNEMLATVIIRSLYSFMEMVKASEEIKTAHNNFKAMFLEYPKVYPDAPHCVSQTKDKLKEVLKKAILVASLSSTQKRELVQILHKQILVASSDLSEMNEEKCSFEKPTVASSPSQKAIEGAMERFMDSETIEKLKQLVASLIDTIPAIETELTGFSLFDKQKTPFLCEIMEIYSHYFILYTMYNCTHHYSALSVVEERDLILDLNELFFYIYTGSVTKPEVVENTRKPVSLMLRGFFDLKAFIASYLVQLETVIDRDESNELITLLDDNRYGLSDQEIERLRLEEERKQGYHVVGKEDFMEAETIPNNAGNAQLPLIFVS